MIGITWTGADGSVWDLRTGPVRLTNGGAQAFMSLKFDSYTTDSASRDGQRYQGWRAQPRSVLLPIMLGKSATEVDYLNLEAAWYRTMRPGAVGTLSATTPDGAVRRLDLRFIDDGDPALTQDPTRRKLSVIAFNMVADNPYWYNRDGFTKTFRPAGDQVNFFGGSPIGTPNPVGPPFVLQAASANDGTILRNPGDIEAWPTYTLRGPMTGFSITLDGGVVSGAIPMLDGDTLVIDTSPIMQTAILTKADGTVTNVIRQLTSYGFRRLQPNVDVAIGITITGNGTITVSGDTRYFKAW